MADMSFNFELLHLNSTNRTGIIINNLVQNGLESVPEGKIPNWVIGNHDNQRISEKIGEIYVNAMNAVLLLLPGVSTTYYGEEIGMLNINVSFEDTKDTKALNYGKVRLFKSSIFLLSILLFITNDNYV